MTETQLKFDVLLGALIGLLKAGHLSEDFNFEILWSLINFTSL